MVHLSRLQVLVVAVLAIGILGRLAGTHLDRAHRREFLEGIHIPPTAAAVTSDSGFQRAIRAAATPYVPYGSSDTAVGLRSSNASAAISIHAVAPGRAR